MEWIRPSTLEGMVNVTCKVIESAVEETTPESRE
jgi:hypothetical protein